MDKTSGQRNTSLPGDFVAGLVEGEGCFAIQYRREAKSARKGSPVYFRWLALFAIVFRKDDVSLLEMIKNTLGCGSIGFSRDTVRFQVQDIKVLEGVIVPFFERFQLYGRKRQDFELWKEAVVLLANRWGKPLVQRSTKELARLEQIRKHMLDYKSKRLGGFKWHREI